MAELLDLPEEVVEASILPHLNWNDLLRCRRVCKVLKGITDDYIRLHHEFAPEIEITEQSDKNLESFMVLGIPTTKLFIKNPTGYVFYDKLDAQILTEFTQTYGPIIKSLRVEQLSLHPCFNEWTFLSCFQDLKTFEAAYFGHGILKPNISPETATKISQKRQIQAVYDPRCGGTNCFPENVKSLEILKVGRNQKYMTIYDINDRLNRLLFGNRNLRHVSFPTFSIAGNPTGFVVGPTGYRASLERFVGIFLDMAESVEKGNLKTINFKTYYEEFGQGYDLAHQATSQVFFELVEKAGKHGARLFNVTATWFQLRQLDDDLNKPEYGIPVVSLVNLHPCCFPLEMPNLERIDIRKISETIVNMNWCQVRPHWPALKSIEINVDSLGDCDSDLGRLFKFLFRDIERPQVEELCLKFEINDGIVPKAEDIVKSCPNLKRLRIVKWPGKQKQLISLWRGLPKLEELSLECCRDMGNVAFVGEDVQNPVFFHLKNLRKLTLKGLDQMPKVTDTLFGIVLAHMKLTHLILTSDKPLEKVTQRGINALLERQFAETIEKFSFDGWSLDNVSAEDFRGIEKQFRSSQML